MSTSSEAKNLEAISRAIDQHNASCEYPAVAIAMNPFEVERLGWEPRVELRDGLRQTIDYAVERLGGAAAPSTAQPIVDPE